MKTRKAIKLAGGQSELAAILGIKRQAVHQWGENVPALRRYQLLDKRPDWFRGRKA